MVLIFALAVIFILILIFLFAFCIGNSISTNICMDPYVSVGR